MRIATITYSWAQNWGAVLQAYALVEYLNSQGHDAKLIRYRPFDDRLISTVKSIPDGIVDLLTISQSKRRIDRYNEFRKNALKLTQQCVTHDELKALNDDFDCFITGSDQVWNIGRGANMDFYLTFADENKKRVSYAASFGVSAIPCEHQQDVTKGLSNIQMISVREESGRKIVSELDGRVAEVVLDPVFLLSKEQWLQVSRKQTKVRKPYIFVYPTQVTQTLKKLVRKLKKETGLIAVSPFYVPGCKTVKDIGPREFIDYIAGAEYVVATSFHATAFSLIFEKKLFVVTHSQTGSRTTDLLKAMKMEECIIGDAAQMPDVNWHFSQMRKEKEIKIALSKNYLQRALDW